VTTADAVREKAQSLAQAGTPTEEALAELLDICRDRRVAVVLAQEQLAEELEASPSDPMAARAAELTELLLERLPLEA
jgi:hypothetical protein